jgi:hypothetical protein
VAVQTLSLGIAAPWSSVGSIGPLQLGTDDIALGLARAAFIGFTALHA